MEIPVNAIREYIKNAIDLIINVERLSDGRRKITSINEITNISDGEIKIEKIFAFEQSGLTLSNEVDGAFIKYDYVPISYNKIKSRGIDDVDYLFSNMKKKKKKDNVN